MDNILALYLSRDQNKMDEFKAKLIAKYAIRELGEAQHFLGIRIVRERSNRKLWLIQDSYINKLADKFNITVKKPLKTPLLFIKLTPYDKKATAEQIFNY